MTEYRDGPGIMQTQYKGTKHSSDKTNITKTEVISSDPEGLESPDYYMALSCHPRR